MRISVVVVVFNLEDYVCEALDSVIAQTRSPDEIIVVDDSSTDRSAVLIKAYGDQVTYVKTPENSGALLAALRGVKAATGDVIAMLDGDDYWASNKLEVVDAQFRDHAQLMLLSHDHVRVDAAGNRLSVRDATHRNIARALKQARSPMHLSRLLRESILEQRGYWLGSAYSFRKSRFDIIRFEEQISSCGPDWLRQTYLDLAIAPFLVLTEPEGLVGYTAQTQFYYRVHDKGSLAGNVTPAKAISSVRRGRSINELILLLLRENRASPRHIKRRKRILDEYEFLVALYQSDFRRAFPIYARLAMCHWTWRELSKETARLVAVRLLGAKEFLARK